MLKNYFKIAWRNLMKHKLFSFINIFGLASGMTVCMLAMIKIKEAYDYDTFHPNSNKTYRITTDLYRAGGEHFLCASSPLPLAKYLKDNYRTIDKSTSVHFGQYQVTVDDKKLGTREAFVDADFYTMFGFKLFSGSPATTPQSVVLTNETAERFFGKQNPIGRTITIDSTGFLVTGILEKSTLPSHLRFDLLASTSAIPLIQQHKLTQDWSNEAAAYTYVQLKASASNEALNTALDNAAKEINQFVLPFKKSFAFDTQPLNKISPGTKSMVNATEEPDFASLIVFASIGISILLLAFFNYVNLTLARSLDRAREVGIRKVSGALKHHLVLQFLSESVLVAILAFVLAYVQLKLISTLPTVSRIIGGAIADAKLWIYFLVFTVLTGLVAGWIPAKVLSSFKPVLVLKGKFNARLFGGPGLRKTLTVIQFATSLIAIVTLAVVYRQSIYMATADYGFERDRILNMDLPPKSYEKSAIAFSSAPGVEEVSGASSLFGFFGGDIRFIKKEKLGDSLNASYFSVSPSTVKNMGIQLIAGNNLPAATLGKSASYVLINEEACRTLAFKNPFDAIGKLIWINDSTNYTVSGVVKDFHYASFRRPMKPLLLVNEPDQFRTINLKVARGAELTIIPSLERKWKKLHPNEPFTAEWFDKQLYEQHLHRDDLVFIGLLTGMAVSIACLGLLGMVIYTTKNRAKEVGIRRVMGATVVRLLVTISKEFVGLLLVSVCIGLPIGFLAGQQFLKQYVFRLPISFAVMAESAGALLLLGVLTIGWQTYRTAIANPVKSLRTE